MQQDSHAAAQAKFDSAEMAATYRRKFVGSRKDRREKQCIRGALAGVPKGSRILDLPCGTGRITTFLLDEGFRVHASDFSPHMLEQARDACAGRELETSQQDVMKTTFADGEFDAVVCNRLFHHFTEAETRRRALRELRRISRGPIVLSFFSAFALSAVKFRVVNALRGVTPTDRVPIRLRELEADVAASGLAVDRVLAVRWGVSPQTYVRLRRA
jgi:SAM-dependent methyltransferase